ncbi:putative ribonuclease H-like domain-containing protein [Tanacetum coccineum]
MGHSFSLKFQGEFDKGYVAFRGGAYGGRITGKGTLKTDNLDFEDVYFVNELNFNLFSVSQMCDKKEKGIKKEYSVARTPQQNGVAERRNKTLIVAARTIGFKPTLSFMRPFGCHVTIFNTLDNLGKFDDKSDEVAAGTILNESAGTQGELNAGTSTQKEEISQDCIVMPIWKDALYFDSPSKDVGNGKPNSAADDQKQVKDGPHNESDEKDKSEDDSSPKEVNAAGQHVNTASPNVNTGSFKLNTVDPSVNTASSYELDSPKDMFKLGASHTLENIHVEFFSDEDEPEVDLGTSL